MSPAQPLSRRRFLAGAAVLGATAASALFWNDVQATAYPPIQVPAEFTPLLAQRVRGLHAVYDKAKLTGGLLGLRAKIRSDLRTFTVSEPWMEAVVRWIDVAGWADASDLLVDAAERGTADVRRTCAVLLIDRVSPLLVPNGYGPRLVKLHRSETDPSVAAELLAARRVYGV
jgi:hypothetical protein